MSKHLHFFHYFLVIKHLQCHLKHLHLVVIAMIRMLELYPQP